MSNYEEPIPQSAYPVEADPYPYSQSAVPAVYQPENVSSYPATPTLAPQPEVFDDRRADEEAVRARSAAIARTAVNGVGLVVDMIPTVLDPSTLLDAASLAARIPQWARRIPAIRTLALTLERFDPTPDVPAWLTMGSVAEEAVSQIIPSSFLTRTLQIAKDIGRIRHANQAAKRLASMPRPAIDRSAYPYPGYSQPSGYPQHGYRQDPML